MIHGFYTPTLENIKYNIPNDSRKFWSVTILSGEGELGMA